MSRIKHLQRNDRTSKYFKTPRETEQRTSYGRSSSDCAIQFDNLKVQEIFKIKFERKKIHGIIKNGSIKQNLKHEQKLCELKIKQLIKKNNVL